MAMTNDEFECVTRLKRGDLNSPANRAARLVLVDGLSQADAMRKTGATRSTVCDAVRRYLDADVDIRDAYRIKRRASANE
jgi:transposase